jgi:hypothetical protein
LVVVAAAVVAVDVVVERYGILLAVTGISVIM